MLDKKQKRLLISFFIIILISAILLLWHFDILQFNHPKIYSETQKQDLDLSVLDNEKLKQLKNQYKNIEIGETGRDNPFEPL